MLRFSLLTLLGVVVVAAIGSAALANPTDTWRQAIITGTVAILLVASSAAVVLRPGLPFARGFAATGWLYFVLAFGNVSGVRGHLLTERATTWLCQQVHHEAGPSPEAIQVLSNDVGDQIYSAWASLHPKWQNFTFVSRSLWTLILATIGGAFAGWLGRRQDRFKAA